MNVIDTKNMNISGENMRTYNIMLNYLYQTTKLSVNEERMDLVRRNALGQSGLWKFGVSGIGVEQDKKKAFEYYKNKSIFVDLIIINNESGNSAKLIKEEIDEELYKMYTLNSFYHTPGTVTVIDSNNSTREDRSLLNMVPRIHFIIEKHIGLKEAVEELQRKNTAVEYVKPKLEENIK